MSENEKEQKSYEAYIWEIADEVCKKNEHPICVEYERKIAELKSKESKYGIKYEVKDVHSRVYRVLNQLVKKGEFFLAEKCYYPNIPKYRRKGYGQLIKKKLRLEHSEVHRVSENTCIVPVTRYMVGNNHYITDEEVIELFEMYIGKANCYKLKIIDNILVIMLRKGICEDEITVDDIESLIEGIGKIKKRINRFEIKE